MPPRLGYFAQGHLQMGMGIIPPCLLLALPKPRVPLGVVQDARRGCSQWRSDDRWRAGRGGAPAGAPAAGCPVNRSRPAGCRRRLPSPANNDPTLRNPPGSATRQLGEWAIVLSRPGSPNPVCPEPRGQSRVCAQVHTHSLTHAKLWEGESLKRS